MIRLAENTYGKSSVRVVKVKRDAALHTVTEWKVEVLLGGDFETCFTTGDNHDILPTDTMKNTVYSRARESQAETIEDFGRELVEFFLSRNPQVQSATVNLTGTLWEHAITAGAPHPSTFIRRTGELEISSVTGSRGEEVAVRSGLEGLVILKTAHSGFEGFLRDSLTTLRATADRLFGTSLRAQWVYQPGALPFAELRSKLRTTLIEAFAQHDSKSVQHTLYAMAEASLAAVPEIVDIELGMPNKHCFLVDLSPFGQTNPNEIFVPTEEPYGNITARLCRES